MSSSTIRPIFIIGNPRSGTSLLRRIINAHHDIIIPPECGWIQWLYKKYGDWHQSYSTQSPKLTNFVNDLLNCKKFETWQLDANAIEHSITAAKPSNYAELAQAIYFYYGHAQGANPQIWGDKNNYYIHHIPLLIKIFPYAKFIFIIRDGRDVASSYRNIYTTSIITKYAPNLPHDISNIALEWLNNNQSALSSLDVLAPDKFFQLTYEQLVTRNRNTVNQVCEFLEVPLDCMMLNQHRVTKAAEPKEFLSWKSQLTQPVNTYSVGRYKVELNEEEVDEFNRIAYSLLKYYKYI